MAVKFSPDGFLDVATEASQLPSEASDKDESSGAMRRCTNLHLDKQGIASTRWGSSKLNTNPVDDTDPSLIMEQNGDRFLFSGKRIYENEIELETKNTLRKKIAFFETDETWVSTNAAADTAHYRTDEWSGNKSQGLIISVTASNGGYSYLDFGVVNVLNLAKFDNGLVSVEDDYIIFYTRHSIRANVYTFWVQFLDSASVNYYSFYGVPADLEQGDNKLTMHKIKKSDFTNVGMTDWSNIRYVYVEAIANANGPLDFTYDFMYLSGQSQKSDYDWSGVKYNAFNSLSQDIFCTNGIDRIRIENSIIHEWGMDCPDSAPAIAAGRQTGLSGEYNVATTYTRKEGDTIVCETNLSDPPDDAVTLTNESLKITVYPPEDPQVASTRVYRTDNAGAYYYLLEEFPFPSSDKEFGYIYSWELDDGYISDKGYKFVTDVLDPDRLDMIDCDALTDSDGTWSVESYFTTLSLETLNFKEGSAAIKVKIHSFFRPFEDPYIIHDGIIKYRKAFGYWDLSSYNNIGVWLYTPIALTGMYLYFGENAYNEQTTGTFSLSAGWTLKTWDISGITYENRDRVTYFGVRHDGGEKDFVSEIIVDQIYADVGTYSYAGEQKTYDWEPVATTSYGRSISVYPWEPVIIDDNSADSSLGAKAPEDNDRPPYGSFVFGPSYTGMLFMLVDNKLCYSKEKQPEYWPLTYYIEVCSKDFNLKGGCIFNGQVYVATTDEIYLIQGTGHTSFSPPLGMSAITGTISRDCFLPVAGQGIFHLGNDGVYLFSGSKDENITNSRFRPIFEGITVGSIPGIDKTNLKNSWMIYFNNKLYFGYPKLGSTYPDNIIVTDFQTNKSVHYDYGETFPVVGIDYTNKHLMGADTSGYIWKLEDSAVTTDDGTAISWQIETKEYSDQLRKYFPRFARYDVNIGTGATANGYVLLDTESKQTHTLTVSRKTKKRLIIGCTGDRVAIRISGTGPVDIYACEVD